MCRRHVRLTRMSAVNVAAVRTMPRIRRCDRPRRRPIGPGAAPARPQPGGARGARLHRQGRVDARAAERRRRRRSSPSASVTSRPRPTLREAAAAFTRAAGKRAHRRHQPRRRRRRRCRHRGPRGDRGRAARRLPVPRPEVGQVRRQQARERVARRRAVRRSGRRRAASPRASSHADAANLARELANTPANLLTARGDRRAAPSSSPAEHGLAAEVFDRDQLATMGCGGMLGVNAGSAEPPRMVKLTYTPRTPKAHVALVGKGVMYDSGGLSLKPTNPMSVMMKMDMSGAAAVLATMTALKALGCRNKVTAFLMCTDNMPSGSALKLGDVLTFRNGKTAEIHNTDAEGRLILADGLALAAEEQPDAIVDIATLTGAALAALGPDFAAVIGSRRRRRAAGRGGGGGHRRAGVGAAARRRQVPQAARLGRRRHEERRRPLRRRDHRGDLPLRVRRRRAVGAHRHRRSDECRWRRRLEVEGRHRLRHPPADRLRHRRSRPPAELTTRARRPPRLGRATVDRQAGVDQAALDVAHVERGPCACPLVVLGLEVVGQALAGGAGRRSAAGAAR